MKRKTTTPVRYDDLHPTLRGAQPVPLEPFSFTPDKAIGRETRSAIVNTPGDLRTEARRARPPRPAGAPRAARRVPSNHKAAAELLAAVTTTHRRIRQATK